jgi:hypothetical protein
MGGEVNRMLKRVLAGVLLTGWAVASAQTAVSKVLVATGKQVAVQTMTPGTWVCEGGQVTTSGPPFCSPGTTKVAFTYMSTKYSMQDVIGSAADLLTGENITVVHGIFDGTYFGHMWGHFEWTVPAAGGKWQGTFTATADQIKGFLINNAVAFGNGGKLEGLKLEFTQVSPGAGQAAVWVAQVTAK